VQADGYRQQLKLVEEREKKLEVRSPCAGRVGTWDVRNWLTDRPVQRGQKLMWIFNPEGEWQLEILMPERRMGNVVEHQQTLADGERLRVEFILASEPNTKRIGWVREIHDSAEVHKDDEGNTVLIKVAIDDEVKRELPASLRPGMVVTAKIQCGKRAVGYVLFHDLIAFLRTKVLFVLGTVLLLTGPQRGPVSEGEARTYLVKGCTITLIDEVNVPAEEAGKLVDMQTPLLDYSGNPVLEQGQPVLVEVREGTQVSQGQLLARIDDRVEQKLKKVAEYKLQVAEAEAGNDVSVRYAEAASKVAKQEYDMKRGANLVHPGSVAQSEVQRAALALRQAELQIEQSTHELNIAKVSVSLREAELEVAEMQLERRQIEAPIDGIIVDRHVKPGEWVKPGDPVLRIVRINRVRIKASVPKSQVMPAEIANQPVAVRFSPESAVRLPRGVKERAFQGRVGFVSPVVDPDGSYTVWADVENVWFATAPGQPGQGFWVLRPGDTVEMTIDLRPVEGAVQTAHAGAP